MKVRVLEPMDGWKWYSYSWDDTKGARVELFCAAIVMFLVSFIASLIPFFGRAITSFVFPLFLMGTYFVSEAWDKRKEKEISLVFKPFSDNTLFRKLLPLCLISMGFGVISGILGLRGIPAIITGPVLLVLHVIQSAILYFSPPLIVFDNYAFKDAMKLSVKAVVDNIATFTVAFFTGVLLTMMGIATVFIGLAFLMPVMLYLPYHIYHSVFAKSS